MRRKTFEVTLTEATSDPVIGWLCDRLGEALVVVLSVTLREVRR